MIAGERYVLMSASVNKINRKGKIQQRWLMITGMWPIITGRWPMITGRWLMITGRWPMM